MVVGRTGKDWTIIAVVAFVIATIGLFIANNFVEGLDISVKTIIFLVLIGVALLIAFRLLGEAKKVGEVSFTDVIIYVGILAGIVFVMIKFNLAPEFSLVANNLASLIGAV